MSKIIFIDIDGPLIPGRAYMLPRNYPSLPFVMDFDPVAVSLLNDLAATRGWQFVIHSSWIRVFGPEKTLEHCIKEGLKAEYFAEAPLCDETLSWRYDRVSKYLADHPEVTDYVIIDDEPYSASDKYEHVKDVKQHLLLIDFEEGLLLRNYRQIKDGKWDRIIN